MPLGAVDQSDQSTVRVCKGKLLFCDQKSVVGYIIPFTQSSPTLFQFTFFLGGLVISHQQSATARGDVSCELMSISCWVATSRCPLSVAIASVCSVLIWRSESSHLCGVDSSFLSIKRSGVPPFVLIWRSESVRDQKEWIHPTLSGRDHCVWLCRLLVDA